MSAALTIEITDREYERSHLRAPRGRGSWAFRIVEADMPLLWSAGGMTCAEAKAWAKATVRAMRDAGTIPADVTSITLATQP